MTQKLCLSVGVFQNGAQLCHVKAEVSKLPRTIVLSSAKNATLCVPFYPFTHSFKLIKIKKSHVVLFAPYSMWGVIVSESMHKDHQQHQEAKTLEYKLIAGDYAALHYKDLMILVRITPYVEFIKVATVRHYRAKLLSLYFRSHQDRFIYCAGVMLSLLFLGGSIAILLYLAPLRPKDVSGLKTKYVLPLISFDNFSTSPEALKFNLNRHNYAASIINHYSSFVRLYMGWRNYNPRYLYASSIRGEITKRKKQHLTLKKILNRSVQANKRISKKNSIIAIPTIYGINYNMQLTALLMRLSKMHNGFKMIYASRSKLIKKFANDPKYIWTQYRPTRHKLDTSAKQLAKIKVFKQLPNEEKMYFTAQQLAKETKRFALSYKKNNEVKTADFSALLIEPVDNVSLVHDAVVKDDLIADILVADTSSLNRQFPHKVLSKKSSTTRDKRTISRAINNYKHELRLCYEESLLRQHLSDGSLNLTWHIDAKGKVKNIVTKGGTLQDKLLISCIRERVLSWSFPRSLKSNVSVAHTFKFKLE